jgi:hypothetical protein
VKGLGPQASGLRWGVIAASAIAAIVVACGGATPPPSPIPKYNEITALWTQIREWRREVHMPLDPTPQDVAQMAKGSAKQARLACPDHHEVPKSCNDTCNLADAICDNAERICQIADELGRSDDYAQGKCASANASCREAKQECCACSRTAAAP